jgi:hypothetical protein
MATVRMALRSVPERGGALGGPFVEADGGEGDVVKVGPEFLPKHFGEDSAAGRWRHVNVVEGQGSGGGSDVGVGLPEVDLRADDGHAPVVGLLEGEVGDQLERGGAVAPDPTYDPQVTGDEPFEEVGNELEVEFFPGS